MATTTHILTDTSLLLLIQSLLRLQRSCGNCKDEIEIANQPSLKMRRNGKYLQRQRKCKSNHYTACIVFPLHCTDTLAHLQSRSFSQFGKSSHCAEASEPKCTSTALWVFISLFRKWNIFSSN